MVTTIQSSKVLVANRKKWRYQFCFMNYIINNTKRLKTKKKVIRLILSAVIDDITISSTVEAFIFVGFNVRG